MKREERRQKIEEIACKVGIPTPKEIAIAESEENMREDLIRDDKYNLEKIELGKKIDAIISEDVILEVSLNKERKLPMVLYRKQRPRFNIFDRKLRPWREQALQLIEIPTKRKVIWMTGRLGNAGETWLQNYIESYFGFHRVARVNAAWPSG